LLLGIGDMLALHTLGGDTNDYAEERNVEVSLI
jgi:hypothetical protein